jgi:hypothetical protein
MNKIAGIGVALTLVLIACGPSEAPITDTGSSSPGSGPVGNASPGGVFTGTLTPAGTTTGDTLDGLITENGDGFLVDTTHPAVYRLTPTVSGDTLTAPFMGYEPKGSTFADGTTTETGTFTGTVQSRDAISGSYTAQSNASGSYSLSYVASLYQVPTPLTTLAGTYQFTLTSSTTTDTVTLTIDSTGALTGSDTENCTYSGTVTIPDPQFDAQQVKFSTTCDLLDKTSYTGLSTYRPATSSDAAMLILEFDNGSSVGAVVKAVLQ